MGVGMEKPAPLVKKPRLVKDRGVELGLRPGRGFSIKELDEAGLTVEEAKRLGIPIDRRRRSKHEWNVKILKEFLSKYGKSPKEGT